MLSGLTIRGRCLLAAGVAAAVCSLVLDERDLLRVAMFVVVLPVLALVLSNRTRFGLRAERHLLPERLAVGSEGEVELRVRGTRHLPIGGPLLEDDVPAAVGERRQFHLRRPPGDEPTAVRYPIRPALRGIHQVGPLRVRAGDPFGLAEFDRELAPASRLVAVPEVVALNGLPGGSGLGSTGDGAARLQAGYGEDDSMVRQYRHGDDMRRVHWKTTAHRDELMVRTEEHPWHGATTLLLDRRSAAHRGAGARSSLEWAISAVASVFLHLHRHGHQVRLTAEDGSVLGDGRGWSGGHEDDAVLDELAAVRPSARRDLSFSDDPGDGRQLIAVLGATTPAGVAELTKLRPEGARSLALLLDVRRWNGEALHGGFNPHHAARKLRASGWAVRLVESPQEELAAVWRELCGTTSTREADRAS